MRKKRNYPLQFIKRNKQMMTLLLGIVMILTARDVNAAPKAILTLDQAVKMALQTDNDILVAENDLAKAKLAVDLEKINALPSASGNAEADNYFENSDTATNLQLKVQQTIPTRWHLYGVDKATAAEAKRWVATKSEAALLIARAETVNDVTALYYSALKAQKNVEYQQLAVDYYRVKADFNQLQLKLGKVTKATQLTAANDYEKARYELEKLRQSSLLALQKLAAQIGLADYQQIALDQTVIATTPAKIEYESQKQKAILERPEINQYEMDLKTAVQEWAEAKNNGLPSLDLSYQNRSQLKSFDVQYNLLSGDLSWSAAWQKSYSGEDDQKMENFSAEDAFGSDRRKIGLMLSWDLDFGSAANKTKQAAYAVESARRKLEQAARDISLEIDAAISDYKAALVTLENNKAGIRLYEKALELAQLQARMGMMTAVDLKKAELDLASSRNQVATATCELYIATQKLKLALGLLYDVK